MNAIYLCLSGIFLPTDSRNPDNYPDNDQYSDGYYHESYQYCSKNYRNKKSHYQKNG